jgi:hypothetical protein
MFTYKWVRLIMISRREYVEVIIFEVKANENVQNGTKE